MARVALAPAATDQAVGSRGDTDHQSVQARGHGGGCDACQRRHEASTFSSAASSIAVRPAGRRGGQPGLVPPRQTACSGRQEIGPRYFCASSEYGILVNPAGGVRVSRAMFLGVGDSQVTWSTTDDQVVLPDADGLEPPWKWGTKCLVCTTR